MDYFYHAHMQTNLNGLNLLLDRHIVFLFLPMKANQKLIFQFCILPFL